MACSWREQVEKMWDGELSDDELDGVTFHMGECEECDQYFKMRTIGTDAPEGIALIEADTDTERRRKFKRMRTERIFRGLIWLVIGLISFSAVCVVSLMKF